MASNIMSVARGVFIVAAIPFTLLAALWLFLEHALPGSPGTDTGPVFALCGGTFIYGSLIALRGQLPLAYLVFVGLVLNIIGAFVWVPALGYRSGSFIGFAGLALAGLWVVSIRAAYLEARH